MKRDLFLIIGLFLLIVILLIVTSSKGGNFFSGQTNSTTTAFQVTTIKIGDLTVKAQIASNEDQKRQGLSGRDSLPAASGMLFVYDQPGSHSFWMKDVHFPLDIIFVGSDKKIVAIDQNIQPEPDTPENQLKHYGENFDSQFVLEVPGGTASENKIKKGDSADFSLPAR